MKVAHRLSCILSDVARVAGIEPTTAAFRAHASALRRWNDRRWNAIGSDDVYFFNVAARLFAADFDPLDLQTAVEKAEACGMRSVAKRLGRVVAHCRAVSELQAA
jgi:hypothetical protein